MRGQSSPAAVQVQVTHAVQTSDGAPSVSFAWAVDQATVSISFAYDHVPGIPTDWLSLTRGALQSVSHQVGPDNAGVTFVHVNGPPTAAGQTVATLSFPVGSATMAAARAMASGGGGNGPLEPPVRGAWYFGTMFLQDCVGESFVCLARRPPCCRPGCRRRVVCGQHSRRPWARRVPCLPRGRRLPVVLCPPPCLRRPGHSHFAHGRRRCSRCSLLLARRAAVRQALSHHWCQYVVMEVSGA